MIRELHDFNEGKWVYPKKGNANLTSALDNNLPNVDPHVDSDRKLAQSDNIAELVFRKRDSNSKLLFVL